LKEIENRSRNESGIWSRSGNESGNRNGIVNERSECMMKTPSMSGLMASGRYVQVERARQVEERS
jgi:hypothetical protein